MSDQHQGSAPPGNDNANTNTPYPPYPNVASPSSTYSGTGTDNTPTSGQPRSNTAPYPSYPSADSSHSSAYPSQPNANAPTTPYPTGAGGSLAATYSQSSTEQHQPAQALPQTYSTVFGASSVAPYPGGPTSQHRPEEMPASYSLAQGLSSAPYPGSGTGTAAYPPGQGNSTGPNTSTGCPTYPQASQSKPGIPEDQYQYAEPPPMYQYEHGTGTSQPIPAGYPQAGAYPGGAQGQVVVRVQRRVGSPINHCCHCVISIFFWPWLFIWMLFCILESRITQTVEMPLEEAERLGYNYVIIER